MLFFISFIILNVGTVNSFGSLSVLSETRPVEMVTSSTYDPQFSRNFNDFKIIIDDQEQVYIGGHISHSIYDSILLGTNLRGGLLWENLSKNGIIYDIDVDHEKNIYCTGIKYVDHNPDIILWKYSSSGTFIWERSINGFGFEWGQGISIDTLNNIYVAGYNSSGGMIVAKYNPNGEQEWLIEWGKELNAVCFGCTLDNEDQIYLVGEVEGYLRSDMCILKLDSLGEELWNITFPYVKGVDTEDRLSLAETNDDGNIFVVGDIENQACYVAEFSSEGINIWNMTCVIDTNRVLGASDLIVDSEDNVYIVGTYRPYDFSDGRYDNQAYNFLFKIQNGAEMWRYYWKFSEYDFVGGLALKDGDIYICGSSDGTLYLAKFSELGPIFPLFILFSWVAGAIVISIIIHSASKKKKTRDS